MEFLIIIGLIWLVGFILDKIRKKPTNTNSNLSSNSSIKSKEIPTNLYRPVKRAKTKNDVKVIFKNPSTVGFGSIDYDIKDLVDALTGAPLTLEGDLYQCTRCKVFYQDQSYEIIISENRGQCVSCLATDIFAVTKTKGHRGQNANVNLITLDNYRNYVGHVITFEGVVSKVLTSRRGSDYAVMFEDSSWTKGFKMVAFKGTVGRIGGPQYLKSLSGRRIRVRGLLIDHERFGFEIIISDPKMIISVQ